jgi:hypothetical protein
MIVYGGHSRYHNFGDVWALDLTAGAERWSKLLPAGDSPAPRRWHSAVYDAVRGQMVVFGGGGGGTLLDDAWTLDLAPGGEAWTEVEASGTPPTARAQHTAIYDGGHDWMVVFGGWRAGSVLGEVWVLNLATGSWTKATPGGTPPAARRGHSAVYDGPSNRMVVFGGLTSGGFQDDLWALSLTPGAAAWSQLDPAGTPPGTRAWHTAMRDEENGRMLVIGGRGMDSLVGEAQWSLDLSALAWSPLDPDLPGDGGVATAAATGPSQYYLPPDGYLTIDDAPQGIPVHLQSAWRYQDELKPEVWFVVSLYTMNSAWRDGVEVSLTVDQGQFEVVGVGTRSREWDDVAWGSIPLHIVEVFTATEQAVFGTAVTLPSKFPWGYGTQVVFKANVLDLDLELNESDAFVSVDAGASDWPWHIGETATARIHKQPEGWIVVNRELLYQEYDGNEVTRLLDEVFEQIEASGRPLVVMYADRQLPSLKSWDNTDVDYASESTANEVASALDEWLAAWKFTYHLDGFLYYGFSALPDYVVLLGDDNVIPFYRKHDYGADGATGDNSEDDSANCWGDEEVCDELVSHNYFMTDNPYGDVTYGIGYGMWDEGVLDAAVGRIVGASAADMQTFLENAALGPNEDEDRAIVVSGGLDWWISGPDNDPQNVLKLFMGYDLNESLLDDEATKGQVVSEMEEGFSVMAAADYGETYVWKAPGGEGFPSGYLVSYEVSDYDPDNKMAENRPFFQFNASRIGYSYTSGWQGGEAYDDTMVYSLVHNGASGIIASAGKAYGCSANNVVCGGEVLNNEFWKVAKRDPDSSAPLGWSLQQAKGQSSVTSDVDRKTVQTFTYFGLPWMSLPGHGDGQGSLFSRSQTDATPPMWSSPDLKPREAPAPGTSFDRRAGGLVEGISPLAASYEVGGAELETSTYVVSASVDASTYAVSTTVGGFDLIEVDGLTSRTEDGQVVLPQATLELVLPLSATISSLVFTPTQEVTLPSLDIPTMEAGVAIPGGPMGGYVTTVEGVYPVSATVGSRMLDGYQLARVRVVPVTYDASGDEATLYRSVDVALTYDTPHTLALTGFAADKTEYVPGEAIHASGTLVNAGDVSETVTATLIIQDGEGRTVGLEQTDPLEVAAGASTGLDVAWEGPLEGDAYRVRLLIFQGDEVAAASTGVVIVSAGEVTDVAVPRALLAGEQGTFEVRFHNLGAERDVAIASLAIYDEAGNMVGFLPGQAEAVDVGGSETFSFAWTAEQPGSYTASFVLVVGGQEYGPVSEGFEVIHGLYLPLVLRNS